MKKKLIKSILSGVIILAPLYNIDTIKLNFAKWYDPIVKVEALGLTENTAIDDENNIIYSENGFNYDGSEEFNTDDIAEDVDDLEAIKDIFNNDYRF